MRRLNLLPIGLFLAPLPAFANERLGGGFGSLIFMVLGAVILLFIVFGLASICAFINEITGRPPDHPFGAQLLMFGAPGSAIAALVYLAMWGSRENSIEDFLVASSISFVVIFLLLSRRQ